LSGPSHNVWVRDKGVARGLQCPSWRARFAMDNNTLEHGLSLASSVADQKATNRMLCQRTFV